MDYESTDVLIGFHGAGITNAMFMKPNSVLIELLGHFDGRMLPLCGYHGPFSAIFGVHHYSHHYDYIGNATLNMHNVVAEIFDFYQKTQRKDRPII